MRDKFKYLSDRQLLKNNIDPNGFAELSNRFVSDLKTDALNQGYKQGVRNTLVSGLIFGGTIYAVNRFLNKKDVEKKNVNDDIIDAEVKED